MKLAVIGSGGREHAIIKALKKSPRATEIYALPGNGGIAADARCVDIRATDIEGIVDFCVREGIELCVVAPDDPLVLGAVDALEKAGIPAFGPTAAAAQIEGSKVFAKGLMKRYDIPTAAYESFDDYEAAAQYVRGQKPPIVIKADGLALGKGVIIARSVEEAIEALDGMMNGQRFGASGSHVVVEEYLEGPEVSVLAMTDGKSIRCMASSMDHKRALDDDMGLNTGGMGTVAPNPYYTPDIARECMKSIFLPTIEAMNAEGRTFKGCLYFGLMLTKDGPRVIEYNCRFGDPETQVVLPLLDCDLLEIMLAVREERLESAQFAVSDKSACCVIIASAGYPQHYEKGKPISIDAIEGVTYYHAGTALRDGVLVSAGGRVIGAEATAPTLAEAVRRAYIGAWGVSFEGAYMRHDIGERALKALER